MDKPEYSKIDPKTRALLEQVQGNRPEVLSLAELKKVTKGLEGLLAYLQKQNQNAERTNMDMADVLFDVKEALDAFSSQEAPEQPDYAKPVVGAVKDLKTALTAAIEAIEVKPQVAAPNVKVEAPKVDLSGVEKAMREIPKALDAAIKKIPKTEVPKTDLKPLANKFDDMLAKLEDIDNGVRMKPQTPNAVRVTNLSEVPTGVTTYDIKNISPSTDPEIATYKYFGFLERGGTNWRIMRKTLATNIFEYATGTSGYATAWTNKSGQSYS